METFDVVLLGLRDDRMRLGALQKLQQDFGIDMAVGTLMLATAPTTVKRVTNTEEAEAYYHALTDIGLEIRLDKEKSKASSTIVGHGDPKHRPTSPIRGFTLLLDFDVKQSMQDAIVRALMMPLRGSAIKWLITAAVLGVMTLGIGAAMLSLLSSPSSAAFGWFGVAIAGAMAAMLVGTLASFARQCFWAVVGGESEPEPLAEVGPEYLKNQISITGSIYFVSWVVLNVVAVVWVAGHLSDAGFAKAMVHPVAMLGLLLGSLYWPIGLALASAHTNPLAFWSIERAIALLREAPLQTLGIGLTGGIITLASWLVLAIVAMQSTGLAIAAAFVVFGPILAYVHGMQGALFGILFKAYPDALE